MVRSILPAVFACALAGCVSTESGSSEREPWTVDILIGPQHLGEDMVAGWSPPLGTCIDQDFEITELPRTIDPAEVDEEVLLFFAHAGEARGSIELNGETVFEQVTLVDRLASAIASAIVEITVCAITSAFPGDQDCDPMEVQIETVTVTRRIPTSSLAVGTNAARVCATDGDFLLADGLGLREGPPRTADDDAGTDAPM